MKMLLVMFIGIYYIYILQLIFFLTFAFLFTSMRTVKTAVIDCHMVFLARIMLDGNRNQCF